jgi:1-deoxy-D-xylulose-5-phosphate synthase
VGFDIMLDAIGSAADLKALSLEECEELATEIRDFIVDAVSRTGGHLGSNLGIVELTIALHRVFDSPADIILFDTGHQAYVHKILTGRREDFARLRQEGGLSGYPNRGESAHDFIENSHASTALSYAHGLATALRLGDVSALSGATGAKERRVVAVVGDGALTGGMAYEALNNLGHSGSRVLVVLNDNGRSYAPTISKLSESLTHLRLNPTYVQLRERARHALRDLPVMGPLAYHSVHGLTAALREVVEPHVFFESLGVRYIGPIDGHDIALLERTLAKVADWQGPIVLHVLTVKGKGYGPAEEDEIQRLHDLKVPPLLESTAKPGDGRPTSPSAARPRSAGAQQAAVSGASAGAHLPLGAPGVATDSGAVTVGSAVVGATSYTDAFSSALCELARHDPRVVAITAAMPGPTGLLGFESEFPERFIDVGIAEQHALTAAAGMAMGGLRPVAAIYSTFLSRAFDQLNLDIGLHQLPVIVVADRAGVTGDDGPSHHGLYDLVLALAIPDFAICCPSEPAEVGPLLRAGLNYEGPVLLRYPKTPGAALAAPRGEGFSSRVLREGDGEVVLIGIGKLAAAALEAAGLLALEGIDATVIDPRVIRPTDPALIERAARAVVVVTAEDGLLHGGAGGYLAREILRRCDEEGRRGPRVVGLGVPTAFLAQAKPDAILRHLGLDGPGIATSVRSALAASPYGATTTAER